MSILPISNIINVTITNTPQGATEKNVNSLGLFTTEQPDNFDDFRVYISAAQVAEDYGSDTVTAQMANAIFAQTPNIRSGNGRLVIIPLQNSVAATAGNITTANISANLNDIKLVSAGDIRVTLNGTIYNLTNLDFRNAVTWADVAAIIQKKLPDGFVEATANGFKITSKKVGTTSTVALAAVAGGTGIALNGAGYFNAAAAVATPGVAASGETLEAAIERTLGTAAYVGVISNLNLTDAAIDAVSDYVQARDLIYFQHVASSTDIAGIGTTIQQEGNTKTRILLHNAGLAEANLFKAAYAGRALSVNFNGSNTSQTMNLKQLATILPDDGLNQTLYTAANVAGVDLYVSYDGLPSVYSTGGNEFFDNVYSDLALKFGLETAGFNYLRQTNTKVPQTEPGMNGLKNAYDQVLVRFVNNGTVAPGSWTSSETFGDPEIFKQNVLERGYYIYSLPITQQNPTEREDRKAPLVQIAVKRAGAIHTSDVLVNINA